MAAIHLLPIAPSKISLLIQITGALLLILSFFVVRRIADFISGGSQWVSLAAVALTAFYLPLNNWALQGMEVSLLTLILSLGLWKALKILHDDGFSPGLYIMLGIATWIRMDMVVPFVLIWGYLFMASRQQRRKHFLWGFFSLALFLGLLILARLLYYHELLPNTYLLKLTGYPLLLRLTRGLYVFVMFVYHFNWCLFLLPLGIFFFRRDRFIGIFFLIITGQILYSIWVGGDAWDWWGGSNRYLAIIMPAFFCMFAFTIQQVGKWLCRLGAEKIHLSDRWVSRWLLVFLLISMVNFNILNENRFLRNWLLLDPPSGRGETKCGSGRPGHCPDSPMNRLPLP